MKINIVEVKQGAEIGGVSVKLPTMSVSVKPPTIRPSSKVSGASFGTKAPGVAITGKGDEQEDAG